MQVTSVNCLQQKGRGSWRNWAEIIDQNIAVSDKKLNDFIVPTVDTVRCNYFLDLAVHHRQLSFNLDSI